MGPDRSPPAMVLCAGLGTRLRPLTEERPKPLVPVGDRPVLAHVAGRLAAVGVARLVVNTHHRAGAFDPALLAGLPLPCELVHEPDILGTAGGVANAGPLLGRGDAIVWNGDILADLDLPALLGAHRSHGALATLAVVGRPVGEGTVGLDGDGRVVRLRAERYGSEQRGADFAGVQVIGDALRAALPRAGCLVGDGYQPALRAGGLVRGAEVVRSWRDVGSLPAYLDANVAWLAERGSEGFTGPGASIAPGVRLTASVLGAEARVEGSGVLRRCVLWPGAAARAPLCDAVVTTAGTIVHVPPGAQG